MQTLRLCVRIREKISSVFPPIKRSAVEEKECASNETNTLKKKLINRTTVFASLNRFLHNSHFNLALKTSKSTSISSRPGLVDAFWPRRRLVVVVVVVVVLVVAVVAVVVVFVVVVVVVVVLVLVVAPKNYCNEFCTTLYFFPVLFYLCF